jgi:thiol-disulfide isomerase/thioredoxin
MGIYPLIQLAFNTYYYCALNVMPSWTANQKKWLWLGIGAVVVVGGYAIFHKLRKVEKLESSIESELKSEARKESELASEEEKDNELESEEEKEQERYHKFHHMKKHHHHDRHNDHHMHGRRGQEHSHHHNRNVEDHLVDIPVLELYYASWCGASRAFIPTWQAFANEVHARNMDLELRSINCDEDYRYTPILKEMGEIHMDPQEAFNRAGVEGYPSLYLVTNGKRIPFEGPRTMDNMLRFISQVV